LKPLWCDLSVILRDHGLRVGTGPDVASVSAPKFGLRAGGEA
jgi:hypothetical protein